MNQATTDAEFMIIQMTREYLEAESIKRDPLFMVGVQLDFQNGLKKGIEYQKEIDRHEIERLKKALNEDMAAFGLLHEIYPDQGFDERHKYLENILKP